MGDQPVSLESARLLLGTPDVEKLIESPLEDSFQYIRYLVDPRKAEDMRLTFTVAIEGAPNLRQIELRNGVAIVTHTVQKGLAHINVTRRQWSEFVSGQRSFAHHHKAIASFESVFERNSIPESSGSLDKQLDVAADAAVYTCD